MAKCVYLFGDGVAEGSADMKMELGGKGANLAEMSHMGIPVPPGFTISTTACKEYHKTGEFPKGLMDEVRKHTALVERMIGRCFGAMLKPLLFSVRSGAPVSMPGMMDTVLNLGLNEKTIAALIEETDNPRFAYDSYRRLLHMFSDVVMHVPKEEFEEILSRLKEDRGVRFDTELSTDDLKELISRYKKLYKNKIGENFPEDPWDQLEKGIRAVFDSWNTPRAITYRKLNNISEDMGTAVTVQSMVFGNLNDNSATGVAFTRHPATGEDVFYGEYLVNAQGEDVVAGTRTPQPINEINKIDAGQVTLESLMPEIYKEIADIRDKLDEHYRDMQDIEFTIQDGRLYMLQTRAGKRTANAAVKIAMDYLDAGKISEEEALMRVDTTFIDQLLHPQLDPKAKYEAIATGLPAGPGAAVGQVVLDAATAEKWAAQKKKVVLVRNETTPDDIGGMDASQGILTALGGMTSHAALVARGMGKTCIVGCSALKIDIKARKATIGKHEIREGDWLTLAVGNRGEVILGQLPLIPPRFTGDFGRFLELADKHRRLRIRTNADTPKDAKQAREFGAEGIGLTRTEHMFFAEDRIPKMQRMILAEDEAARRKALDQLRPLQQGDFEGIFEAMDGLPATIRLIDPPLHEFLPQLDEEEKISALAREAGVTPDQMIKKIRSLHELNPMLGHRGCRLTITYPEIAEMQTAAIIGAACACKKRGVNSIPEIMVPLIGHVNEFKYLEKIIRRVADETIKSCGVELVYSVGTMIEIPRAAMTAGKIAEVAEFFSFGTNDLTQMGFGFSRDDIGSFLPDYLEKGILPKDPFQTLDQGGIGLLLEWAVKKGRETRPSLKVGICGEHGGDPASIGFCHSIGCDYVSCSPYRVPIARLAAAQAAIREKSIRNISLYNS
jgi:pyruvate,orthophosphate dikinase